MRQFWGTKGKLAGCVDIITNKRDFWSVGSAEFRTKSLTALIMASQLYEASKSCAEKLKIARGERFALYAHLVRREVR